MIRTLTLVLAAALLSIAQLKAHDVVWLNNEDGFDPTSPVILDPFQFTQSVAVAPSEGEPCTVEVLLDKVTSPYFTAEVLEPKIDNTVWIQINLIKAPPTDTEAVLTGAWFATTAPDPKQCDAVLPNEFSVPIFIPALPSKLTAKAGKDPQTIDLSSMGKFILQAAQSLAGPWFNVAKGTNATVTADQDAQYFRRSGRLAGSLKGSVTDSTGKPHTGLVADLAYGGVGSAAAADGSFTLHRMPYGNNVVSLTKPFTYVDPDTGTTRTINQGIEVEVPLITASGFLQFKMEVQVFVVPCNCTPWCAIGYGTFNDGQTPVYFSGGINQAKGSSGICDAPTVTVTPPNGPPFNIKSGSGKHQNSGPNPASGTWTITTTVCGISKSCTIDVP